MVVSTTVFSDAYARPPFLAGQPNPGPAAGATGTFLRSPPQTAILGGLTASAQICEQLAADINRTHRDYCQNSPKNGAPTCAKALTLTLPAQRAASGVFTANPGVAPRSGTLRGHCCESRNARLTTTIVYAGQRGVIFLESESRDFQASRISTYIYVAVMRSLSVRTCVHPGLTRDARPTPGKKSIRDSKYGRKRAGTGTAVRRPTGTRVGTARNVQVLPDSPFSGM